MSGEAAKAAVLGAGLAYATGGWDKFMGSFGGGAGAGLANSLFGGGMGGGGPEYLQSGAPLSVSVAPVLDTSQWIVATGGSRVDADQKQGDKTVSPSAATVPGGPGTPPAQAYMPVTYGDGVIPGGGLPGLGLDMSDQRTQIILAAAGVLLLVVVLKRRK